MVDQLKQGAYERQRDGVAPGNDNEVRIPVEIVTVLFGLFRLVKGAQEEG